LIYIFSIKILTTNCYGCIDLIHWYLNCHFDGAADNGKALVEKILNIKFQKYI